MKQFTLKKRVAGVTLQVPIYVNEKVTDELIDAVNERVQEIAEDSTRIDTHGFALLAALSFAAQLRESQEARRTESQSLLKSLRKVTEALRSLARDYGAAQ